jgi:hypothetical protein
MNVQLRLKSLLHMFGLMVEFAILGMLHWHWLQVHRK